MLLPIPDLTRVGFDVNAKGCRGFKQSVWVARDLRNRGKLPKLILINAYGNGGVNDDLIKFALKVIGPKRTLVLVTAYDADTGHPPAPDTDVIVKAAKDHPDQIKLLDWVKLLPAAPPRRSRARAPGSCPTSSTRTSPGAHAYGNFLAQVLPGGRRRRARRSPRAMAYPGGPSPWGAWADRRVGAPSSPQACWLAHHHHETRPRHLDTHAGRRARTLEQRDGAWRRRPQPGDQEAGGRLQGGALLPLGEPRRLLSIPPRSSPRHRQAKEGPDARGRPRSRCGPSPEHGLRPPQRHRLQQDADGPAQLVRPLCPQFRPGQRSGCRAAAGRAAIRGKPGPAAASHCQQQLQDAQQQRARAARERLPRRQVPDRRRHDLLARPVPRR